jgi:hypothetical protein
VIAEASSPISIAGGTFSCTLVNFVRLVNRLSVEFPQLNIVLRPHPSENRDFYQPAFDGVPNVHVTREGSVGPWLFACRAMIHDGCTTGLEAFFGEVPIISYKPLTDPQHDLYLPNLFGVRCTSDEEVLEQVGRVIAAPAMPAACGDRGRRNGPNRACFKCSSGRDDATSDHAVHGPACYTKQYQRTHANCLENFRGDAFTRLGTILDDAMATADIRASKVSLRQFTLRETLAQL